MSAIADADVETSSDEYARRFAGPVGAWFLDVQARLTLRALAAWPGASVLDVGGGHAQLTGPLVEAGFAVTAYGSDPVCSRRLQEWMNAGRARFQWGPLARTPFAARSFDAAVAYRLLPHVDDPGALVAELCRVARRAVVVDYPTRRSANAVADAFFAAKKSVEGDTRPFAAFKDAEVRALFAAAGFRRTSRRPEFFFPMALHRAMSSAPVSRLLEGVAWIVGLRAAFGSPVIARFERND